MAREIKVTLILDFGNDSDEPYSDAELLNAITESMAMEPIEIGTEDHATTFEITGGELHA